MQSKQKQLLEDLSSDDSFEQVYGIQKKNKLCPSPDGIIRPKLDAIQKLKNTAGGLNDGQMRVIQEEVLLDSLQKREKTEKYFDISLSGTSATIVIQLPKKLIVGWVGDSGVAIQNREKVVKDVKFTENHSP